MVTAGDSGHGCANQGHEWVRNNLAVPKEVISTAAAVQNAGEPEGSDGDKHGQTENSK